MPNPNTHPQQDKYSKLAGNTIIFAISSFSSKLLTFIVQPFLTYAMRDVENMGISKLLSQCANLLIPFVSMGMSNAIIRFGLDKSNDKKHVFTNGLLTILAGYLLLIALAPVMLLVPGVHDYALLLYIYVLTSCLRTLCTQFVRSRELNRIVALDGVLCTFSTLMFYVLYLVVLDMGANGYLLAIICGDILSSLFLFICCKLWQFVDLRHIDRSLWRQMLRFSLPMIPAQISFWIINASDMFFVNYLCDGYQGMSGTAWSGLLSTGYFMPTILNTLGLIFYDAWQLSAVTEEAGREAFFSNVFRIYSSVMFCCAAGIIWLCRPVMHIMRSDYYASWQFVPFLAIAAIFTCFNQFFNSIYVVYKRSANSLFTMLAGAVANCVLNYLFILWWGPVGVTIASFLSLFLVFVLRAVNSRGLLTVNFSPARVGANLVLLVAEALILLRLDRMTWVLTTLITLAVILFNFRGVWGMMRLILLRLLGRFVWANRLVRRIDRLVYGSHLPA